MGVRECVLCGNDPSRGKLRPSQPRCTGHRTAPDSHQRKQTKLAWLMSDMRRIHPTTSPEDDRQVSVSTISSMSIAASQMNAAVEENIKPTTVEQCRKFCQGNPITAKGRQTQVLKIIVIVMIPVIMATGMIGKIFLNVVNNYLDVVTFRKLLLYSINLGRVIHHLQEERDISALYRSSTMEQTKQLLTDKYPETDVIISHLPYWAPGSTTNKPEFSSKDKFLSLLNKHRYELDSRNQSVTLELQFYTSLIRTFTSWVHNAITGRLTGSIWRRLIAYHEIIIAKQYMGLERTLGTVFYAKGTFSSHDDYLWFVESRDVTTSTFLSAIRYSKRVKELFQKSSNANSRLMQALDRMRTQIRRNDLQGGGSIKLAKWWFNNMTLNMDILLETRNKLAMDINLSLDVQHDETLSTMIGVSCLFAGIVLLFAAIMFAVYSLTDDIQLYSVGLAERTTSLNKENKQTDQLLFQMLPRSVARKLKRHEDVPAEWFESATIFFSDIQGFTKMSSKSSPIQIVFMLNNLYSCFDSIIAMYNVYKVETIGDAYMVASGVPKQSNHRHAAEICNMAAHILSSSRKLVIPHQPGTTFKLRIGCHTGSVVAGVVGTKMPRYCLFGETISIAAKMESLGKPGKIHITETTMDGLCQTDGFIIEERFEEVVKNELGVFHTGEMKTFWLHKPCEVDVELAMELQEQDSSTDSDGEDDPNDVHVRGKFTAIM